MSRSCWNLLGFFGAHTLLERSLRLLQLSRNLSNLIGNGHKCNPWVYTLGCAFLIAKDTHFVCLEALTMLVNNPINIF